MHFLSALLTARNNVAQGYAAAAARESGPLQSNQIAHRQQLAELEWLLHQIDRHESNPFALPSPEVLIAHQVSLLLKRTHPVLQSALGHRASNHARNLLLEMNQSLRELRRILLDDEGDPHELSDHLNQCIAYAESVNTCCDFDEVAERCTTVFNDLNAHVRAVLGVSLPALCLQDERPTRDESVRMGT
jgi:hypothetical protein